MEKSASLTVAAQGDTFSYQLVVTNQGPADSGRLLIDDFLPEGLMLIPNGNSAPPGVSCRLVEIRHLQCLKQTLASQSSVELSIHVQVTGSAFGQKFNKAVVQSEDEDPSLTTNNQASVSVMLVPRTDLNRDGRLDGKDAANLVFELNDGDGEATADVAGGDFPGTADYDINADGSVTREDVEELARWILFRIPEDEATASLSEVIPQGAAASASILDFPRLSFAPGRITGIAIVNPNAGAAPVTLTAYSSQGAELAMASRVIEPGQQLSELTFELFGQLDEATEGWFQAVSPSPDLAGFFLDLDGSLSELDGADLPERSNEIVFNTIKVDAGSSTELNIVNPNPALLSVTLELVGAEPGQSALLDIPAMGSIRIDVTAVFGVGSPAGAELTPASYIIARASAEILGFQVIRSGTLDFQGLNARSALEFLNKIYIPQMAVLGVFESELGIVNYSGSPVLATISAFEASGELFSEEVQQNPVVLSLQAGQTVTRDLAELFGFQGEETLQGWLQIESSSQAINGYFSYRIPATGAQAAISAVAEGSTTGIFSHLATVPGFFTGVAALNTASYPADYRILALSQTGEIFGTFSGVLRPRERNSQLISDLIPAASGQNGGIIFIRSTVPLFLTALFGTDDVSVLANIPPQRSPATFNPDANITMTRVSPPLNVLQAGGMQDFTLPGVSGAIRWTVNGTEGGTDAVGRITPQGTYTAPQTQPAEIPVTVVGEAEGVTSSASVDIIQADSLTDNLGEVLSVAFLEKLGVLYTAELSVLAAGDPSPQTPSTSAIFAITPDSREQVGGFDGEISQIVPFLGRDGRGYLLLVDSTFGNIIRFDPETRQEQIVLSDLEDPGAVTLDALTGDLLVADANQITIVSRSTLEGDLTPAGTSTLGGEANEATPAGITAPLPGIGGIAVDLCTGMLYLSQPSLGKVIALDRSTLESRDVLVDLDFPFRLRGVYRKGVSCPQAFHLFIVERGRRQVDLYVPSEDRFSAPWLEADRASDLVLLPPQSRFGQRRSLVLSRRRQGRQMLSVVDVESVYRPRPVNPPPNIRAEDRVQSPGPDLAVALRSAGKDRQVNLPIFFRPGPNDGQAGGADELLLLMFSVDYDERRLIFDPADADLDGVPDAIQASVPEDYLFLVFFNPELKKRELAFLLIDTQAPYRPIPEIPGFSIRFRTSENRPGTALVGFRSPGPQVVDIEGNVQLFDQILIGGVGIKR